MWLWLLVGFLRLFLSYSLVDSVYSTAAVTLPLAPKKDKDGPNTKSPFDQHDKEIIRRALANYDSSLAPILKGHRMVVNATVKVLSAPSFHEQDGTLELNLEMQQCWVDSRLNVHSSETLDVSHETAPHLWSPHLIFYGAKTSHVHSIVYYHVKNFIRPGGEVVQILQLTLSIPCIFSYFDFPLDHRRCKLTFGSSLSENKILYKWGNNEFPLEFYKEALEPLSRWGYSVLRLSEGQINTDRGLNYSTLTAIILASRVSIHDVVEYVVMLTLIVLCSFAPTFVKDNLPARVISGVAAFGITVAWVGRRPLPTEHPGSCYTCIDLYSGYCVILVGAQLLVTVAVIVMKEGEKLEVAPCRRSKRGRRKGRRQRIKKEFRLRTYRRVYLLNHRTAIIHALNMEMKVGRQEGSSSQQLTRAKWNASQLDRVCHILSPIALLIGLALTSTFLLYSHYRENLAD